MKRASTVLALLALGFGGAAAANASTISNASSASIHLSAPRTLGSFKKFRVTAYGHALPRGSTYIAVVLTGARGCPATFTTAESKGVVMYFPTSGSNGFARVSGSYSLKTDKYYWGGAPTTARLCGYLYKGTQFTNTAAKAKSSRLITFT
jgi:hypothetical protein